MVRIELNQLRDLGLGSDLVRSLVQGLHLGQGLFRGRGRGLGLDQETDTGEEIDQGPTGEVDIMTEIEIEVSIDVGPRHGQGVGIEAERGGIEGIEVALAMQRDIEGAREKD